MRSWSASLLFLTAPFVLNGGCTARDGNSGSTATGTDTGSASTTEGETASTESGDGSGSTSTTTAGSTSTVTSSTGGDGLGPYGGCIEDGDCPTADAVCLDGTVCAPMCNPPDLECPAIEGGTPLCVFGVCQLQCATDDDCPDGMVCGALRCNPA